MARCGAQLRREFTAGRRVGTIFLRRVALLFLLGLLALPARAALQFDVFLGFDGATREGNWFPIACEIFNDGPAFNAVFEVTNDGDVRRSQVRQIAVELPTNTRKRFVIPVFSSGRHASWSARLIDERGKVRAEQLSMTVKNDLNHDTFVMGALSRVFGGLPVLPNLKSGRSDATPFVARMEAAHFPDNPIAFEAMDALYLNTEKALDLKTPQKDALIAWLNGGGHLIVAVEQPADVNGTPWLRNLLPCEVTGVTTVPMGGEFQNWIQDWVSGAAMDSANEAYNQTRRAKKSSGRSDPMNIDTRVDRDFEAASLPIAEATVREGKALVTVQGKPLVIQALRGRGKITVLTFSPEREPFRTWKHRPLFWARAAEIAPATFTSTDGNYYGRWGIDGVFGAMLDSKQVRKLPIGWLLVLLIVYLLVVGPLDQYWLKKINRQMLTWITFPAYVVLFSVLIYWIGFMLRAGEVEWNELHVVDVLPLPGGERAHLRGQMFASIYSPSNARYELVSDKTTVFATLRGEFAGAMGGGQEASKANVQQRGDGFRAEMYVPVWVNQLYVSDWLQLSAPPLGLSVTRRSSDGGYDVTIVNKLARPLKEVRVIVNRRLHEVGDLEAQGTKKMAVASGGGADLMEYINRYASGFQGAVQQRRNAFGNDVERLDGNNSANALAASFATQMTGGGGGGRNNPMYENSQFVAPERFNLLPVLARGDAIVVAWDPGSVPVSSFNKFSPRRTKRDTFYRLSTPVEQP
jgi:hypothetical protein